MDTAGVMPRVARFVLCTVRACNAKLKWQRLVEKADRDQCKHSCWLASQWCQETAARAPVRAHSASATSERGRSEVVVTGAPLREVIRRTLATQFVSLCGTFCVRVRHCSLKIPEKGMGPVTSLVVFLCGCVSRETTGQFVLCLLYTSDAADE